MKKTDITLTDVCLKNLIGVIKSNINNHPKPIYVSARHSDAFIYILSGGCTYTFEDNYEFTVDQGDILYLAHKSDYKMQIHTTKYEFIYCDFILDGDPFRKSDVYSPTDATDAEILFNRLLKEFRMFSKISFYKCISLIYDIYGIILMSKSNNYAERTADNKIVSAKEYIDANFADITLSVTALAEQAGMSDVYFRKLFKKNYHMSPSQYIRIARIKAAKKLLHYNFLTLEECSIQSGFSSVQYFCRVFKKETGMTPSEYKTGAF